MEDGQLKAIKRKGEHSRDRVARRINASGCYVVPGFIDIHMHGAGGHDTMDATPQTLEAIARFIAAHGVTAFLPTTMAASQQAILAAIENAARCQSEPGDGAQVVAIHLEGPYISPSMPGAQSEQFIRPPDPKEFAGLFAWGNIRLITLAPEVPANQALIAYAAQQRATVAVGHSTASYAEVLAAVRLGLRHAAHTFNGMCGLHHREPGTAGAVLACDEITAEVIADNMASTARQIL